MSIKKINGYKILLGHKLGQGAYASVYKGQQDGTHEECAIKVIQKKKVCQDPYLKSALLSEIQIMAKLQSANIVKLFDVLESSHNYYIIQELCDSDLDKYLNNQSNRKVNQKKAIEILTEICNGFLTLVKQGIVHRDLKPANILINKGVTKLGDFGFAKDNAHKKVKNQTSVGTPLYMPIEILKGETYTSKCDIWAIGCIFYQLLHGLTPFTAKTQFQLVSKIETGQYKVDSKLSDKTKDFISKTLKVHEDNRICWDDLFKHQIFNGYFSKYSNQNQRFQNKYKKVMRELRFKVNSENIDIASLWEKMGFQQDKQLQLQQFQSFIKNVNPDITNAQQIYFFEKLDVNGDGSVSLKQLSAELQKYSISLTSKHNSRVPFQVKKTHSLNSDKNQQDSVDSNSNCQSKWGEHFEKKVKNCFSRLYKIIEQKKLTLFKTFVAYDFDNSGVLNFEQFSRILKKLDSSFSSEEIKSVFEFIDEDGSNSIEFDEMNKYYCKINSIPVNLQLPKQYIEKKRAVGKQNRKAKKKTVY